MRKRGIAWLLSMSILLSCFPAPVFAEGTEADIAPEGTYMGDTPALDSEYVMEPVDAGGDEQTGNGENIENGIMPVNEPDDDETPGNGAGTENNDDGMNPLSGDSGEENAEETPASSERYVTIKARVNELSDSSYWAGLTTAGRKNARAEVRGFITELNAVSSESAEAGAMTAEEANELLSRITENVLPIYARYTELSNRIETLSGAGFWSGKTAAECAQLKTEVDEMQSELEAIIDGAGKTNVGITPEEAVELLGMIADNVLPVYELYSGQNVLCAEGTPSLPTATHRIFLLNMAQSHTAEQYEVYGIPYTESFTEGQAAISAEAMVNPADCLYTFQRINGSEFRIHSGDIYLDNSKNAAIPNSNDENTSYALETGFDGGSFHLHQVQGGTSYLYFYRNGTSTFGRVSYMPDDSFRHACSFLIFMQDEAAGGCLPGYRLIKSTSELGNSAQCLIAAYYDGGLYLLKPGTSADSAAHVGRVATKITVTMDAEATSQVITHTSTATGKLYYIAAVGNPANTTPAAGSSTETITIALKDNANSFDETIISRVKSFQADELHKENVPESVKITLSTPEEIKTDVKIWSGAGYDLAPNAGETLDAYAYELTPYDDGFLVSAEAVNGGLVFLNINGEGSSDQGYPNSTTPNKILFKAVGAGNFRIYDTTNGAENGVLKYSKWNFFTKTPGGAVDESYRFYLFGKTKTGYHQIFNESELGGNGYNRILITATKDDEEFFVLRPFSGTTSRNAHTARIESPCFCQQTAINIQCENAAGLSEFSFTLGDAKTVSASYTVKIQRDTDSFQSNPKNTVTGKEFTISVPADAASGAAKPYTIRNVPAYLVGKEISYNPGGIASLTITGTNAPESYGCRHDGSNKGYPENYNGEEVALSDCLFQWNGTGAAGTFRQNDIYLNLSAVKNPYTGSGSSANVTVEAAADKSGIFRIHSGDNYLAFRRNNWGVFFTRGLDAALSKDITAKDCDFYIYATGDDADSRSPYLPGYHLITAVSELTDGGSYLIAAFFDDNLYILNPSAGGANDNVVMANKTHTTGSSDLTFLGKSVGMTEITVNLGSSADAEDQSVTYTVHVVKEPGIQSLTPDAFISNSGAASGMPVNKITMSAGLTYEVVPAGVNPNEIDYWVSSDSSVATVENGIITAIPSRNVFGQCYIGCADKSGNLYAMEVVVIQTSSSVQTKHWDLYVEDVENSDVYYTWTQEEKVKYTTDDLKQVYEHEVLYVAIDTGAGTGMNFFGKAHTGYALAFMNATNSNGDYKSITADKAEDTVYYKSPGAQNQINGNICSADTMKSLITAAKELNCTGAMGFSRTSSSRISFRSCKLPTLEKKVLAVIPADPDHPGQYKDPVAYRDGMQVYKGDEVHFMITVRVPISDLSGLITYDKAFVTDLLPGAQIVAFSVNEVNEGNIWSAHNNADTMNIAADLNKPENYPAGLQETLVRLYVRYIIKDSDASNLNSGIHLVNEAEFEYQYHTSYDEKSVSASASARAILTVGMRQYLKFVNLSLSDSIGVNVYFPYGNSEAIGGISNLPQNWIERGYKVVYEVGADGAMVKSKAIRFSEGTDSTVTASGKIVKCKRFSIDIAPQDLSTPIYVYIVDENGDRITEKQTFTVRDYAKQVLGSKEKLVNTWHINDPNTDFNYAANKYDELTAMIRAMLNYGTAMQDLLRYRTGTPANSILTAAQRQIAPFSLEGKNKSDYFNSNGSNGPVIFEGMELVFNSDNNTISIRVYFNPNGKDVTALKAVSSHIGYTSSDPLGTHFMFTEGNTITRVHDTDRYYVSVGSGITPQQFNNAYKIRIYYDDGTKVEESWVALSVLTYAYMLQQSNNAGEIAENNALLKLCGAMDAYNKASETYFGTSLRIENW